MAPTCQIGALRLGPSPAVVGVVSRAETLIKYRAASPRCEIIELRADLIGSQLESMLQTEKPPQLPRLLTIRNAREGGRWAGAETERVACYTRLLPHVHAVDVEIESHAFDPVLAAAKAAGRGVIASFHDFVATPTLERMRGLVERAVCAGADVVKIATWTTTDEDVRRLEALLCETRTVPLAVMGMGPLGVASRLRLALAGSCLVYGYLDEATAPGQLSADEWVDRLSELLPAYRAAHAHA
jgi:3-dehydroquinate dehydratase-1